MQIRAFAIGLILILALMNSSAPVSADPDLSKAVQLFKKGKYNDAAYILRSVVHADKDNDTGHYYLALCYKNLRQNALAKEEFEWILNHSFNRKIIAYAQLGLKELHAGPKKAAAPAAPASSQPGYVYQGAAPTQQNQAAQPANKKKHGKCTVVFFETDGDPRCEDFVPTFEAAQKKYQGRMDFHRINGETDHRGLKERYKVTSYPRLVYLDEIGNVLYNEDRGRFQTRLKELAGE